MSIWYEDNVKRALKKGKIPKGLFVHINNAFIALDTTKDMALFDIKRLKTTRKRAYYHLRKGQYRAIFYLENNDFFVISIAKREEAYRK